MMIQVPPLTTILPPIAMHTIIVERCKLEKQNVSALLNRWLGRIYRRDLQNILAASKYLTKFHCHQACRESVCESVYRVNSYDSNDLIIKQSDNSL